MSARGWVVAAVVAGGAVFFATQGHTPKHYSDTPGQGLTIERQSLPALDESTGGRGGVVPSNPQNDAHVPANSVGVEPRNGAPPAVPAQRSPDPTTNTATGFSPGDAAGSPSGQGSGLGLQLPLNCDLTCLAGVLHLPFPLTLPPGIPTLPGVPTLPIPTGTTLPTGTTP